MFIGRDEEIKKLHGELSADDFRMILLFGRRRIGKSELLRHVLSQEEQDFIYYECKQTNERNNIEALAGLIAEADGIPRPYFGDMEELLRYFFEKGRERPRILVLDEYPYLRKEIRGLDSILQSLVDQYHDESRLKFVLCGSYMDIMRSLIEADAPLYGRVSLTIELKAMDYYETAKFFPQYSAEDKVMLYSVFGGVPYYNRWVDPSRSAHENIMELLVLPGSRFEHEVLSYLSSELSKLENANEIFEAMARGFSKYSDILSQSHVSGSAAMASVLDKLIRMEIVEKRAPINDRGNKRKAGYFISDPLSLFYYKYIFRYLSQRAVMDGEVFFERYIREDFLTQHIPAIFERICREFLIRRNRTGKMEPPFFAIGKYYYDNPEEKKNGEFDLVTEDENGYVFYEVKYRKKKLTAQMVNEEIRQIHDAGFAPYRYGFFARSGYEKDVASSQVRLYTLDDVYAG